MENSNLLNPKESRASNCGEEEEGNKHHGQNSDDRISDLPDDILHHILSFLPIKSVVQTSILSRRWSYLWASFPFLNFSTGIHEGIPDCQQSVALMEFISRVLSRRHENSNIKVFRVAGHMSCSRLQYDILSRVLKHKVGHLELKIFLLSDLWDDPHCLFECDSLRRLELESISDNLPSETNIPYIYLWAKSSGLRSLHTLSLKRVNLLDIALDLVDLFSSSSSFPFLERLAIENCNIVIPDLKISCPSLKDLKVSKIEINSLEISGMRLENLEVYFPSYHCTNAITWVKIFAPNLQTFSWVCDMITEKYSIGSFPILRESYIHISEKFMFHIGRRVKINLAVDLLSVASQVQDLSILGHGDFQILSNIYFEGGLPFSFVNLKILYISSTLEKCEIPGLACLFKSSPIAHSLTIEIHHVPQSIENWNNTLLDDADCTVEQYWESQAQSLTSFLSQLKEVKIHVWNFIGFVHESAVKTARFLLNHGRGLQKMSLSSEYTDDQPLWKDKVDLFQGVSCASAHVKIVVEHQNSVNGDCYSYPLLYNSGHWYFA